MYNSLWMLVFYARRPLSGLPSYTVRSETLSSCSLSSL